MFAHMYGCIHMHVLFVYQRARTHTYTFQHGEKLQGYAMQLQYATEHVQHDPEGLRVDVYLDGHKIANVSNDMTHVCVSYDESRNGSHDIICICICVCL